MAKEMEGLLRDHIERGSFPSATFLLGQGEEILAEGAFGWAAKDPHHLPAKIGTIYDLASLTKPLVTAFLTLYLAQERSLDLNDQLHRYDSSLKKGEIGHITIIELLTHAAGFSEWYPLYTAGTSKEAYMRRLIETPLAPKGKRTVQYTCLGYILLGFLLERVASTSLSRFSREVLFSPLGLKQTHFPPRRIDLALVAPSEIGNRGERRKVEAMGLEFESFRDGLIWGEVNDGNAYFLGGAAGNAGLFSTAYDIYALSKEILGYGTGILSEPFRQHFFENLTPRAPDHRSVGWRRASSPLANEATGLSHRAIGHTGYTGTSLWIDPETDRIYVLLTNRGYPARDESIDMNAIRAEFHSRAATI